MILLVFLFVGPSGSRTPVRSSSLIFSRSPHRGVSCLVPSVGLVPSCVWGSGSRASLCLRALLFLIAYGLVLSWWGVRPPRGHTSSCVRSGPPSESHDPVIHHSCFVRLFINGFRLSDCSSFSRLFVLSRSPRRGVSCLVPLGGVSALLGLTCAVLRRRVSCRCFLYLRRRRRWPSSSLVFSRSPHRGCRASSPR